MHRLKLGLFCMAHPWGSLSLGFVFLCSPWTLLWLYSRFFSFLPSFKTMQVRWLVMTLRYQMVNVTCDGLTSNPWCIPVLCPMFPGSTASLTRTKCLLKINDCIQLSYSIDKFLFMFITRNIQSDLHKGFEVSKHPETGSLGHELDYILWEDFFLFFEWEY